MEKDTDTAWKNHPVHNFESIFIILDILEQDYLKFYESYQ